MTHSIASLKPLSDLETHQVGSRIQKSHTMEYAHHVRKSHLPTQGAVQSAFRPGAYSRRGFLVQAKLCISNLAAPISFR
jgi:hypothetical protein